MCRIPTKIYSEPAPEVPGFLSHITRKNAVSMHGDFVQYDVGLSSHSFQKLFSMKILNPYLIFNGNTEEAFQFYKSVFGGEFNLLMRMKDVQGMPVPESEKEKIMHIALPLSNGQVLMGSDTSESSGRAVMGTNCFISIHVEGEEEGAALFKKLVAGGKSNCDFGKQFWGSWHGNLIDKYGTCWMVNYDPQP